MYLIFDSSNIAFFSPINRAWEDKLHIWGEVGCAISWDIMYLATETVHQLRKLSRLLQHDRTSYERISLNTECYSFCEFPTEIYAASLELHRFR